MRNGVFFDLAINGGLPETEQPGCIDDVPLDASQSVYNCRPLVTLDRREAHDRIEFIAIYPLGASPSQHPTPFGVGRNEVVIGRDMVRFDDPAAGENHEPLDGIF